MPAYVNFEDVRVRVIGKVRFTTDVEDENKMSELLARRLIDEAEGQVELDLSPRYAAPFISETTGTYKGLPDRPTKNIIRTLCELKAVIRILETDFGTGTAIDGDKYIKKVADRYKDIIDNNILAKVKDDQKQWKFPPLPDLKKNWFNTEADDGYSGMMLNTSSSGDGGYPAKQINDPSETFWNGLIDD